MLYLLLTDDDFKIARPALIFIIFIIVIFNKESKEW